MRILIISTFFPPLNSIASLRPYSFAKHWSSMGHDVTVLTTEKNEDEKVSLKLQTSSFRVVAVPLGGMISFLKKKNKPKTSEQQTQKPPGLKDRFFNFLRFKKGVLNAARMPDITDFWIFKALKTIQKEGPWDLVVSSAGPYSVHLVAYQLKKKGLCPFWIADYRDTWSNNYIYPGLFPFNLFEKWLEKKILTKADAITTISAPFADSFKALAPQIPAYTIENGFDPDDQEELDPHFFFSRDGKFRIVHTGSLYLEKRDPTPLFKAICLLRDEPEYSSLLDRLEVIFVGPRQANLQEMVKEAGVEQWVKLEGFVCRKDALRMQRDASALLFLAWNDPSIDGVLTGKIFEYLSSKTPIIAVGASQLEASQKLILEAKAGYVFFFPEQIKQYLIEALKSSKKETLPFQESVINRYNRKHLATEILNIVST